MVLKKLYVFDFDDTLVSSGAAVKITHKDGTIEELQSHEFATYIPKPGDDFDFDEFEIYPPNARLIGGTFNKLQSAIQEVGPNNVVVLSARGNAKVMTDFLRDQGLSDNIDIIGLATANPNAKARYVQDRVLASEYNEVHVFEDSMANINAIKKAVEKMGDVQFFSNRVQVHNESILRKTIRCLLKEILR